MNDQPTESKPKALTLEQIAATRDCEVLGVDVPEWGGTIYLRVLPADEGLELSNRAAALPKEEQAEAMYIMLARCLCDEEGTPLVRDQTQEARAIGQLKTRSQKVLLRIQKRNVTLQGWDDETGSAGKGA